MWLEKLKELKKQSGMSSKDIADKSNIPEKTVKRIFSGETDNPYADTLYHIVNILGGSLDDIFADSKAIVGTRSLATLQDAMKVLEADLEEKNKHIDRLLEERSMIVAENTLLRQRLQDKEEIITLQREIVREYHARLTKKESGDVDSGK